MKETIVTFNNGSRKISMYFTEQNGDLSMQMSMEPEFNEGEEPDLPMLLASTFMNALNAQKEDESESKTIVS
ncbi:MAG: hypothetical protein J6T10_12745 [Methanobrevibacter sp.]|nr:hypothetical protein [Methanobrevibacter sp.]